jgi:N-carbamoylputrescine amidase
MRCVAEREANWARAEAAISEAAARGARLICLPELFATQYFCQREDPASFDAAEPVPGPGTERLGRRAREAGAVVIASLFERRAPGLCHNAAAVIDADGRYLGKYRKMHIPDDPLYHEKYYFAPGDLGFLHWDTAAGRIGVCVCWDQWFPEAARLTALRGADVLFYPTAIGWHPSEKASVGRAQCEAWECMHRAHAIANGVFVAAVNRVGHERLAGDGIEFWGSSLVIAPDGRVLSRAPHDAEETLVVEIDRGEVENTRRHWPFLRDRRVDAYGAIGERFSG